MWSDAILSYLHATAVFVFFAFLSIALYAVRSPVDATRARDLARLDRWYWGSVAAVAITGAARVFAGAKGAHFYTEAWPLYAKLSLFALVLAMSIQPSSAFRRWAGADPYPAGPSVAEPERKAVRRRLMAAVHVAALVPLLGAMMARGLS